MASQSSFGMENKKNKQIMGRQKIEMKKIVNRNHLQVTFTKRHHGLFNKASELSLLCGAKVAIFMQSTNYQKVYAFGNPSFLTGDTPTHISPKALEHYHKQYLEVINKLNDETARKKTVKDSSVNTFWWNDSFDELGLNETQEYIACLEELKNNVLNRAEELKRANDESQSNLLVPNLMFEPLSSLLTTEQNTMPGFESYDPKP